MIWDILMMLKEPFSEEWILGVQKKHRSDPILAEKVVLALTLLEQLVTCGLDFVFIGIRIRYQLKRLKEDSLFLI